MVPFALSGLMSWPGKVRMGMDLVLPRGGAARRGRRATRLGLTRASATSCAAASARRRWQRIAEPIVAGIHAGDPEQMSVRATFPMFLDMEREHRSLILAMLKRRKARQKAAAARGGSGAPAPAAPAPGGGARRPAHARTSTRSRAGCRT